MCLDLVGSIALAAVSEGGGAVTDAVRSQLEALRPQVVAMCKAALGMQGDRQPAARLAGTFFIAVMQSYTVELIYDRLCIFHFPRRKSAQASRACNRLSAVLQHSASAKHSGPLSHYHRPLPKNELCFSFFFSYFIFSCPLHLFHTHNGNGRAGVLGAVGWYRPRSPGARERGVLGAACCCTGTWATRI